MGWARLLAKGWVLFCLYAAVLALAQNFGAAHIGNLLIAASLFLAMGVLFAVGYGLSGHNSVRALLYSVQAHHLLPDFNRLIFLIFILLSLITQILLLHNPHPIPLWLGWIAGAMQIIPGQHALLQALAPCAAPQQSALLLHGAAVSWLLALIYLASSLSRIRLAAGLIRLERSARGESAGAAWHTALLGLAGIIGIQLFGLGSVYGWTLCQSLTGLPGQVLTGLAPLMLAYLLGTALTAALSLTSEQIPPKQ